MTIDAAERLRVAAWLVAEGFKVVRVWGLSRDGVASDVVAGQRACAWPAGRACAHPGKHPAAGVAWQKRATSTPSHMRQILLDPHSNYGVYVPPGSDLLILDLDRIRHAAAVAVLALVPPTFMVRTAKGCHVYLRTPEGFDLASLPSVMFGGSDAIEDRIGEVRMDGNGQVVGPWSEHASGATYTPEGTEVIATATPELLVALAGLWRAETSSKKVDPEEPISSHNEVWALAMGLRVSGGLDEEEILAVLRGRLADGRIFDDPSTGKQPWSADDLRYVARDAGRKARPRPITVNRVPHVAEDAPAGNKRHHLGGDFMLDSPASVEAVCTYRDAFEAITKNWMHQTPEMRPARQEAFDRAMERIAYLIDK